EGGPGGAADGDDALLAALAEDAELALREIHAVEIEPAELRDPEPAGVEGLEDRLVAEHEHRLARRSLDDLGGGLGVEEGRQGPRELRGAQLGGGVGGAAFPALEV